MISTPNEQLSPSRKRHGKSFDAFKAFCKEIWFIPIIAVIIAILILVIEHAHAQILAKFFSSFIYATLIGFPTALILNWVGFRYTERFPRLIFVIFSGVLLSTAIVGTFIGAAIIRAAGIIPPGFYMREVRSALPISLVITLTVGLSVTAYETLRHRLQDATLQLRTQQMEQERANKLLAEARLSSLESRIHPHFLFNTLNSISSLIPTDPKRAEDTVGKLASLLRFSINANQASLVPLEQELKIVRDYLEIEATRFGPRLRYEISVPENLSAIRVPPLALQTVVENSIKHVAAQCTAPVAITISAAQRERSCELTVTDDGPGFSLADISPDHGLANLIGRLELLYGDSAQLTVAGVDSLSVVTIRIPAGDAAQ
ncbi:sensor histidine kinase [Occallatibacter savannae]|uniref:sensor histidine kinase n=1 Tax=Occallatibacter savannae TaxID=1002691 RepID=UPI000D69269E|nr:histidine kinase [Occallatibacter savannae]